MAHCLPKVLAAGAILVLVLFQFDFVLWSRIASSADDA